MWSNPLCFEWFCLPWRLAPLIRLNCLTVCCLFLQESAGEISALSPMQWNRIGIVLRCTPRQETTSRKNNKHNGSDGDSSYNPLICLSSGKTFWAPTSNLSFKVVMSDMFKWRYDFHPSLCISCDKSVSKAERQKGDASSDAVLFGEENTRSIVGSYAGIKR